MPLSCPENRIPNRLLWIPWARNPAQNFFACGLFAGLSPVRLIGQYAIEWSPHVGNEADAPQEQLPQILVIAELAFGQALC